jgi:hypothetical protein
MNRRTPLVAALAAAAILTPRAAQAATFYVDDDAAASPPACTAPATPCKTIADAVGQARLVAGPNTISIAPGTYPERLALDQPGDVGLTLDGAGSTADPAVSTIVAPAADGMTALVTLGSSTVGGQRLQDVRVRHLPAITDDNGVALLGAGTAVENVAVEYVTDPADLGIAFSVARTATLSRIAVEGAYSGVGVHAFGAAAFDVSISDARIGASSAGPAVNAGAYAQLAVRRSILRAANNAVLSLSPTAAPGSVLVDSSLLLGGTSGVRVSATLGAPGTAALRGVTIDPGAPGPDGGASFSTDAAALVAGTQAVITLSDSIAVDPQRAQIGAGSTASVTCTTSDVPAQEQAAGGALGAIACGAAGGNVASPFAVLFANGAAGDYSLPATSPALDAGSAAALADDESTTDVAGSPRVSDGNGDCSGRRDRGAYERVGNVVPSQASMLVNGDLQAGGVVAFHGGAVDDQDSTTLSYSWTFAGGTAKGREVTRVFDAPGKQAVSLIVTDAQGCSTSTSFSFQLDPDRRKPTLKGLTRTKNPFRAPGRKRGTTFRFELSEKGAVRLAFERFRAGKRVPWKAVGTLTARREAGKRTFAFTGRLGGKALAPGRYRVRVTIKDGAGNRSAERVATFRVLA